MFWRLRYRLHGTRFLFCVTWTTGDWDRCIFGYGSHRNILIQSIVTLSRLRLICLVCWFEPISAKSCNAYSTGMSISLDLSLGQLAPVFPVGLHLDSASVAKHDYGSAVWRLGLRHVWRQHLQSICSPASHDEHNAFLWKHCLNLFDMFGVHDSLTTYSGK